MSEQLTVGPMALLVGVQESHLRKLAKRKQVPFRTVGRYLAFDPRHAAKIREAAVRAGYLSAGEPAPARACPS